MQLYEIPPQTRHDGAANHMADILKLIEKPASSDKTDNSTGINLVDLTQNSAQRSDARASTHSNGKASAEVVTLPAVSPDTYNLPTPDTLHLSRQQIDADLNRKYQPLKPGNWNNDSPLHDYYENGLLKLQGDADGKRLFGIRISAQKNEHVPFVPIGKQQLEEKGVALELRLKFP